ncbi:hypothetical protein IT418_00465 [bacterium]|nr:hypothetical protein [bacterium]
MTKKQIFLLGVGVLIIAMVSGIFWYTYSNKKTLEIESLLHINIAEVTPTVTEQPPEPTPIFLIIPAGYALNAEEINQIKDSDVNSIIMPDATEEQKLIVNDRLSDTDIYFGYKYCKNSKLANTSDIESVPLKELNYIAKEECLEEQKIKNIERLQCDIKTENCQNSFNNLLRQKDEMSYIYSPASPLLSLFTFPEVIIENRLGTYIFTWKTPPYPLRISHYSIEVLNASRKRIYASGKLAAATNGGYYMPVSEVKQQLLTTKVRFWYKIDKTTFADPFIVEKVFSYIPPTSIESPTTTTKTKQMTWIPDWGMNEALESLRKNPKKWYTVSPVWFILNKNGTLDKRATLNSPALLKIVKDNKIKLIPTISTFDADVVKEVLNKNMDKHIAEIMKTVNTYEYDGIDLDYESTYEADKELLITFVTKLADKLHKNGKILSFTAIPKIDDRRIYSFLPQTHQAQDWQAIGAVVDEFRIMAYDYTGQGSLQPGPLSPVQWNETLIKYALSKMPGEKIVLALPLYSHGWPKPKTSNLAGSNNDKSLSSGELKNTISLQHDSIDYVKRHSSYYREKYDPWVKEMRAEFKYNGVERIMYYLNKQSIESRINLAEKYGITGVCYWRIGGERL